MQGPNNESKGISVNGLQIIQQGEDLLVNARLLHEGLKVKTKFADWIKARMLKSLFKEGKDYFSENSEKLGAGRRAIDYHLTIDMAKHIAMLENNEIGYRVRDFFIKAEKKARGISYLPPEAGLFKGLKPRRINDRLMYPYREICERCGYARKASSAQRRAIYWMHFMKEDYRLFITEEFSLHLYHQKRVANNRPALKAMPPVIPANFGDTSQLKLFSHES